MDLGPAGSIAVLIPCFNEELAIGGVVESFRTALPGARIYVYDNNSVDHTVEVAKAHGAEVRREVRQGKGAVVRRMFADVEADIYVLVDGDGTYDADSAPQLIRRLLDDRLDMVAARRVAEGRAAYRSGHVTGNRLLTGLVTLMFGRRVMDMLSGYRVFSRRFVKSFPALSHGFEVETELTVHALELALPFAEVETPYRGRVAGSSSKLNTWGDGFRILLTVFDLVKNERPLSFFLSLGVLLSLLSLLLGWPVVSTWIETGLVPRLPTALLAVALMLLGFLSVSCGLVLDTVTQGRREAKRLAYLAHRAPGEPTC